jgi:hypothetical protein
VRLLRGLAGRCEVTVRRNPDAQGRFASDTLLTGAAIE